VPGTGSPETVEWAAKRRYTYAAFLTPLDVAEDLFKLYHKHAEEVGYTPGAENFAFMVCCHVNDTDARAQEEGKHFLWRMGHPLRAPQEYMAPPGYVSRIAAQMNRKRRPKPLNQLSYQELQEANHLVIGSPETVIKKLRHIKDRLGIGALLLEAQAGQMSHHTTMKSIELFGREVIPALKEL
jgi:alkanesulfonate monooxygenase SsuD/methylene tetrahydromethanopterin reductase-like flavin-dependent oxidoreductase (luciferase family)